MESRSEISSSSITALSVASAFKRALEKRYTYLFSPNESELLNHFCKFAIKSFPMPSLNGLLANTIFISPNILQTPFFNTVVAPYYEEYILLRKLMIKEKINMAIDCGAKQIVFLGGGYDIRAFMSAQQNPNVNFYELDRGLTRQTKLEAISTIPNELGFGDIKINKFSSTVTILNDNLFYLECDFSVDDLSETLAQYGFDKTKMTIIIAEGLTMYLDQEQNAHTLKLANQLMEHPESELLIGYGSKPISESGLSDLAKQNANENYKFYLSLGDALTFTKESKMCVVAMKAPINLLNCIDENEGMTYFQNNNNANTFEQYYLMRNEKYVSDITNQIEDIPEIELFILRREPEPSRCCLQ